MDNILMHIRDVPGGKKYPYGLDYYLKGKRYRPTFQTKIERERFKKELVKKIKYNRSLLINFDQDFYLKCLEWKDKIPSWIELDEIFRLGLQSVLSVKNTTTTPKKGN